MKYRTLNEEKTIFSCIEEEGRVIVNVYLAKSATAPATTGDATLVPESTLQPETRFEPRTNEPYVTKSGFIRPYPDGS